MEVVYHLKVIFIILFFQTIFFLFNDIEKASNQQEIWKVTTLVEKKVASEISQNTIDFKHFLHFKAKRLC